jgi:DNA-binding CsgD family transcriptional regulator
LFPFFWGGYLVEGREILLELLDKDRANEPSATRAWALVTAAKLAAQYGDDRTAVALCHEYLALPEHLHSDLAASFALIALGLVDLRRGDFQQARAHITAGIAASRAAGDTQAVALYLLYLAAVASAEGQLDEAQQVYRESVAAAQEVDFPPAVGLAQGAMARLLHTSGQRVQARQLYEQALVTLRDMGAMPEIVRILVGLGQLELELGESAAAAARFGECLEVALPLGHRESLSATFEGVAGMLVAAGPRAMADGVRLLGAASRLRDHDFGAAGEMALVKSHRALGEPLHASLLAEGRSLPLAEAAALARAAVAEPHFGPAHEPTALARLSRREREVVQLLARGSSNRQVADALVIAERTAEMHVSNVLSKLGLTSRAQVAVWAVAHGVAS